MEPPAVLDGDAIYLLSLPLIHRIEGCGTAALDNVAAKTHANEVQVLHDLRPAVDPLSDDAGKRLAEETRTMKHETEPVEERLHGRRDLVRVVRGREDDPVGRHHLP